MHLYLALFGEKALRIFSQLLYRTHTLSRIEFF